MSSPVSTGKTWELLAASLRRSLSRQQFETWFRSMRVISFDRELAVLGVPNNFLREWVLKKYSGILRGAVREVSGADPELEVRVVKESTGAGPANAAEAVVEPPALPVEPPPAAPAPPAPKPEPSTRPLAEVRPVGDRGFFRQDPDAALQSDIVLNSQYMFDSFVVGPSNNLAHAAAKAIAESPGKSYNPLFLHGSVGLGKTHLLQAACHRVLERRPEMRILYLSCETFTNHFVAAVGSGRLESFRYRYRHVDMLLIDDIHLLANKDRTQEEFFHTFNTLYNANRQIVLSSDSTPAEIPTLKERLVSRFKWGMVAKIEAPVYETRVAILKRKIELHDLHFPEEVTAFLAENVRSNIRELEGVVNKLAGMSHIYARPVDMDMAREAVRDLLPTNPTHVSIDRIIRHVADYYSVRVSDLQSKKRSKSIAFPRQVCMYLARRLTTHSLEEIGGYFGGRDHTTVMYAFDKIRRAAKENPTLAQTLERLKAEISK